MQPGFEKRHSESKANESDEALFSHMVLKPLTPEQLFDSLLTATSAHKAGGAGDTTARRDAWIAFSAWREESRTCAETCKGARHRCRSTTR